jgi:hypothetical protein
MKAGHDRISLDDMDANVVRDRRRGSSSVAFLGDWGRNLRQKIDQMKSQLTHGRYANESEIKNLLLDIVKQTFVDDSEWLTTREQNIIHQSKETLLKQHPMLFASFTREYGLRLSRIDDPISWLCRTIPHTSWHVPIPSATLDVSIWQTTPPWHELRSVLLYI